MTQWVKALAAKPNDLSSEPESTGSKEKIKSCRLSIDLHTHSCTRDLTQH